MKAKHKKELLLRYLHREIEIDYKDAFVWGCIYSDVFIKAIFRKLLIFKSARYEVNNKGYWYFEEIGIKTILRYYGIINFKEPIAKEHKLINRIRNK